MCGGPEQLCTTPGMTCPSGEISTPHGVTSPSPGNKVEAISAENDNHVSNLLELAASNDLEGFQEAVKELTVKVNSVGSWYGRRNGTAHMVWEQRTPAMIAALYGSVDVLKYILGLYDCLGDINIKYGSDGSTALHCAAAGGSSRAVETVKLLLASEADLNALDVQGRRPADVIATFPRLPDVKKELENILKADNSAFIPYDNGADDQNLGPSLKFEAGKGGFLGMDSVMDGQPRGGLTASSPYVGGSPFSSPSPSSSPTALDTAGSKGFVEGNEKVKEYLIDPSMPDIKNSLYTTDEFRMFSFKIRPCSRAYSHDWTECPFVHPGENARRRDPRRYHYSCVPCPEFRKGACRRGDACEYAHGVFECWLHPAQYRTRLCKDGTDCARRVCFFAHTSDELRPLYTSSGSTIRCSSPPLCPSSPSSSLMSAQVNHTAPPMSPSYSLCNSLAGPWLPSNVPALHLPGVNLYASRLRSSLNARDIHLVEDSEKLAEFDGQPMSEIASSPTHLLSTHARLNAAVASSSSTRYRNLGLMVSPSNLEEFASELVSAPRCMLHDPSLMSQMEAQMQPYKSSPLQAPMQAPMINSPGFTSVPEQFLHLQQAATLESQLQASPRMNSPKKLPSYSLGSLGRMSALAGLDTDVHTGNGTPFPPSLAAARAAFAQREKRSHSSRDLGAGLSLSDWGSPTGKPEWGVHRDDLSKFRKSASFGFKGPEELDLSWVQKLVKDGPMEDMVGVNVCSEDDILSASRGAMDQLALGSWVEKMHLDQTVPGQSVHV